MFFMKIIYMTMVISIITTMFFLKKSPAKLIFYIIIMTSTLSMETYNTSKNAWVGFSLFFLIVSGLMILFSMVTSIVPKTTFNSNKNISLLTIILTPMIFFSMNNPMYSSNPNTTLIYKMQLFWLIIIMLNLILMIISKIISSTESPFRSKM